MRKRTALSIASCTPRCSVIFSRLILGDRAFRGFTDNEGFACRPLRLPGVNTGRVQFSAEFTEGGKGSGTDVNGSEQQVPAEEGSSVDGIPGLGSD